MLFSCEAIEEDMLMCQVFFEKLSRGYFSSHDFVSHKAVERNVISHFLLKLVPLDMGSSYMSEHLVFINIIYFAKYK